MKGGGEKNGGISMAVGILYLLRGQLSLPKEKFQKCFD